MLDGLLAALPAFASWQVLAAITGGVLLGYFIGAMPGLTASIGMALLIPFTFGMDPVVSIVLLVTLYMATEYAGAIPAILVNTPGVPAAAMTALDGYPMRNQGRAGEALALSILSSACGSVVATVLLMFTATVMAGFALAFGPAEYFAVAVLGLCLISALAGTSLLRALIAMFLGLLLATVGTDPIEGIGRYIAHPNLLSGINFLAAIIGLFALSEVFQMLEDADRAPVALRAMPPIRGRHALLRPHAANILRSSLLGYVIGVIPGAGATIASIAAYGVQRRFSRQPELFGRGNPEGVVASETANNAAVPGALAPMLALGIPGSASAAVLIGALTIHSVQPGPLIFERSPEIPYSIFLALLIGMPLMVLLGLWGARLWVRVTLIPRPVVAGIVAGACLIGVYASSNDMVAVWTAVVFGIVGYVLRKAHVEPAPIVLALVLGYLVESNMRRALVMSGDDPTIFVTKPMSAVFLGLAALLLASPWVLGVLRRRRISAAGHGHA